MKKPTARRVTAKTLAAAFAEIEADIESSKRHWSQHLSDETIRLADRKERLAACEAKGDEYNARFERRQVAHHIEEIAKCNSKLALLAAGQRVSMWD